MWMFSIGQALLAILLVICLASFAWGMGFFFKRPVTYSFGMRITQWCGVAFGATHVASIAWAGEMTSTRIGTGSAFYITAILLYWWTLMSHGSRRLSAIDSSDAPQHLVEHGPYRFIRHPFYTSYLLTWTAGAVACTQWWLLATVAIMLAIYIKAAFFEEGKFSNTPLAGAYAEYRAHTGLFLPNPFKLVFLRESRRGVFNAAGLE